MYHSITIGGKNTWDDWRLVPASRPVFNPPAQKVKTLEIPGGDGVIDLSQSLTGYPVYQNRTGSIEFIVMNDFKPWHMAYSDIMDYLHGQKLRAVLEDDPEYFYEGRFTVNVWKSEKDWSRITIDYDVGPYKWSVLSSTDDWLWDPVCPVFRVSSSDKRGVHIRFINPTLGLDETKLLPDGVIQFPEFVFFGDLGATLELWCDTGTGSVSVDFRQGRL